MTYSTHELAKLAGITVRALHYYDQVGLLRPARTQNNDYRHYEEKDLLKLQQILFFRELDFQLEDIKRILSSPSFDMRAALRDQKKLIAIKKERLGKLMRTIDKTIKKINREITMDDTELYGNFTKEEAEKYAKEARERWGDTDAYKQSRERVKKMDAAGMKKVLEESEKLIGEIAVRMKAGDAAGHERVQILITRHYDGLRAFYEPNLEIYRGLAKMYIGDPRFAANYEKVAAGLAQFMHDAMMRFAEMRKEK